MIDFLVQPFQFPFMRQAFLMAAIISVPTAMLSCFLVLKGWSLMGDGVSHAVLPGVVLAYLAGLPLIVGAFLAGMTCALATGYLAANSRVKSDTVLGVVFSGMFGVGIVLFVAVPTDQHLDHILFGNILGVGREDLWTTGIISAVVSGTLALKWRDWLLHTFDPAQAQVSGLRVGWLHYGLLTLLSLTVVAVLSAVGIILAVGLLIAPGAIAFLLVRRFGQMLAVATTVTLGATFLGTWASFHVNAAPAPTIVLVLTAVFLLALMRRMSLTRAASSRAA